MKAFARQNGFTILETLMVVALIGVIATIAIPSFSNSIAFFRLSGDARSVSNAIAVAKMRAASKFVKTRLYVNTSQDWFRLESGAQPDSTIPPTWTIEGGQTYLDSHTSFSPGVATTPPPSTQSAIGQAAPCKNDAGADVSGTACVVFNSRGIPIAPDVTGVTYTPTANSAIYVTDGASSIYGVTIAATGMIRLWQTLPSVPPVWNRQ
jgi:prepilin-type N-terminal cleavage/methylation domain-containing protein